jgi:hypothetical protein
MYSYRIEEQTMTFPAATYDLMPDLPVQHAPPAGFFDLPTLVPQLLDLHPEWGFDDMREFLEEKTRRPLHAEDQITLRALHQRCLRLRREFEG